eukprot:TRINITY_DN2419_c0_g2_i1.p1 TRINITY_DN2419_c0_g2~~TRINITY_DN2419_c0_g2_i1.p1  ORF type:complete len:354 (+),score=103.53 TRINITY_DN2419_c0_g2_i1:131-1192(+)
MPSDSKRNPPKRIDSGKYELDKRLGAGCFGEVWRARNTQDDTLVAVKTEEAGSTAPQLEQEAAILNMLRQPVQQQGIVECFYYGRESSHNCMVMELLSRSIEDWVQKCKNKFQPKTTVLLAEQILHRIEYLHSKCIVHRDIKPENFMFGSGGKIHHVYIIDFGLSKRWWDKNKHVPLRQKLNMTGTARYASINAHKGFEQSRRDDLEAIGHMLMYFLRGTLPWSGLDAKTKEEKYKKITEKKEQIPLDDLCKGYPRAFQEFLKYSRELNFMEKPDYDTLQGWWKDVRKEYGNPQDHEYEFFEGKELDVGSLVPLQPRTRIQQPDSPEEPTKPQGMGKAAKRGFCFCGGGPVKD